MRDVQQSDRYVNSYNDVRQRNERMEGVIYDSQSMSATFLQSQIKSLALYEDDVREERRKQHCTA